MARWKIILYCVGIFLCGFLGGVTWKQEVSSLSLPATTPLTVEMAKGFLEGRDDILNGRDFKEGFYHPPKHSRNFWKGYRKGYQEK